MIPTADLDHMEQSLGTAADDMQAPIFVGTIKSLITAARQRDRLMVAAKAVHEAQYNRGTTFGIALGQLRQAIQSCEGSK